MCSKLYRGTKQATDSLSQAIEMAIDRSNSNDGMLSNIPEFNDVQNGENGDNALYYQVEVGEHEIATVPYDVDSDITHDSNQLDAQMTEADAATAENRKSLSMSPPVMDHSHAYPPSEPMNSNAPLIPTPPDLSLFLNELLGLDLNVESITRYQAKPRSMYTFLCLQEFRRDEYSNHFRNVHGNIQCGLNGWMEQRCPLSQYGCTHSIRRFYPKPAGCITHSSLLESFGLRTHTYTGINQNQALSKSPSWESFGSWEQMPDTLHSKSKDMKESTPEVFTSQKYNSGVTFDKKSSQIVSPTGQKLLLSLTSLPFEVLRYITR
jgi:hypothetical protein